MYGYRRVCQELGMAERLLEVKIPPLRRSPVEWEAVARDGLKKAFTSASPLAFPPYEQCQKIGGGYKAVKFRFLLFLWMEPTLYLR